MTNKQFFLIILVTCVTIILWVVFDIIHTRSQITIPEETLKLVEPIDTTFDQEVLNEL